MARIVLFGDFKVNQVKHLNLSSELTLLLNSSDVKMANFEAPIKTNGASLKKSGPNICQHVEAPNWLMDRGFNVVSMANNHTMDFGEQGMASTQKAFEKIVTVGCGTWDEAYTLKIIKTKDDKKIGFIACTQCEFGTLTERGGCGCAWSMSPAINSLIADSRDKVDALIVVPHGGVEYMDMPLPEWRDIYRQWIDLGADAVIASHPHVPQGWEIYNNKPICYSLGNFCFEALKEKNVPAHWYESLCCVLDVSKSHDIEMQIRPIKFDAKNLYISDDNSTEFAEHLKWMNDTLSNDEAYKNEVDKGVKKLLPHYMGMFSRGGMVTGILQKNFIKGFLEGLMGRGFFNKVHALNNIQCESHRWAILRALKQKENIK